MAHLELRWFSWLRLSFLRHCRHTDLSEQAHKDMGHVMSVLCSSICMQGYRQKKTLCSLQIKHPPILKENPNIMHKRSKWVCPIYPLSLNAEAFNYLFLYSRALPLNWNWIFLKWRCGSQLGPSKSPGLDKSWSSHCHVDKSMSRFAFCDFFCQEKLPTRQAGSDSCTSDKSIFETGHVVMCF